MDYQLSHDEPASLHASGRIGVIVAGEYCKTRKWFGEIK